jgi:ATP-dependent helicase HrpB
MDMQVLGASHSHITKQEAWPFLIMTPLPIDKYLPEIVAAAGKNRALVLVAEPGAGKTTRVPPALVRAGVLSGDHPNLVMLQPRRVAARAAAERIGQENGWRLGEEVGYHVRFDRKISSNTRLRVLTEGILTRQLLDDPFLEGIGAVVLDEFHERSLHTDVAAALLREVQQTVRDDLILIVMSATLEAEPVARFLGNCPILRVEGRTFPVEVSYRGQQAGAAKSAIWDRAADAVIDTLTAGDEDVLVFLPGAQEINRTSGRLETAARERDLLVLPLHGSLPAEEQTRALRPADRRKIVLATNIAETSLTIDGVDTVIDSGLARVAGYDPQRGLDRLELKQISRASATQRAGRAGRTRPGRCVRLWSQREELSMRDFELPEVHRVDLCSTVLSLHAWGKSDVRAFGWYEKPAEEMIVAAERLLEMLGTLENGAITTIGRQLMAIPAHPRIARLLLAAAEEGLLEEGAALAGLLSEKDIATIDYATDPRQRGPATQGPSDLLIRLEMLERAQRANFAAHLRGEGIDPIAARQASRIAEELLRIGKRLVRKPRQTPDESRLLKLSMYAYPDRVVRRREKDPASGAMVGGGGVRLAPESVVRQAEFFLALDAREDQRSTNREAMVRIASAIEPGWLEEIFPKQIRRERTVVYDSDRDRVVGRGATYYRDLPLKEDADAAVDPSQAAAALVEAVRPNIVEFFESEEGAADWLARVALLRKYVPEQPWPVMDEAGLVEVLTIAAQGKRSIAELRRAPLAGLLHERLGYPLDRMLDQHAPRTITVPTGNEIKLSYAKGERPVLAVRLQEVFGWVDTPRVAGGRVAVVMHLLAPNYRPVQITDDLKSFWSNAYFQVRKDLRVRYPKHSWPEEPLTAKPEAKGRRRS